MENSASYMLGKSEMQSPTCLPLLAMSFCLGSRMNAVSNQTGIAATHLQHLEPKVPEFWTLV